MPSWYFEGPKWIFNKFSGGPGWNLARLYSRPVVLHKLPTIINHERTQRSWIRYSPKYICGVGLMRAHPWAISMIRLVCTKNLKTINWSDIHFVRDVYLMHPLVFNELDIWIWMRFFFLSSKTPKGWIWMSYQFYNMNSWLGDRENTRVVQSRTVIHSLSVKLSVLTLNALTALPLSISPSHEYY